MEIWCKSRELRNSKVDSLFTHKLVLILTLYMLRWLYLPHWFLSSSVTVWTVFSQFLRNYKRKQQINYCCKCNRNNVYFYLKKNRQCFEGKSFLSFIGLIQIKNGFWYLRRMYMPSSIHPRQLQCNNSSLHQERCRP